MKTLTDKKWIVILLLAAIAAWLIISNTVLAGFTGTYNLHDGVDWKEISCSVREGDADKFSAELAGPRIIKVKYKGDYDVYADISLRSDSGETAVYELHLYREYDTATESWQIESDLNKTE